jgi:hypothetical protein
VSIRPPPSYAAFRLVLTGLVAAGVAAAVILAARHDAGRWLIDREMDFWRSVRDAVVPW